MSLLRRSILFSCLLAACSSTPSGTDAASLAPDTGSPAIDAASPGSDAGRDAAIVTADTGESITMVAAGDCFTLATATSAPSNHGSCGDFLALTGARVDLESAGTASTFCELPGSFTSLASVPASYTSCTWEAYVEGGVDLANHGLIVTDATSMHHYRMHVVSNALPTLVFSFARID
jgi:hypothetical protein